uniref:Uncharacterized protein n=1 Tax=Loa loa TaxID=7209 RepID=A0A1I7VEX7_LOALO
MRKIIDRPINMLYPLEIKQKEKTKDQTVTLENSINQGKALNRTNTLYELEVLQEQQKNSTEIT